MKARLTPEQIEILSNNPTILATTEANRLHNAATAEAKRNEALMLLGYNQALYDNANWPDGHTDQSWAKVIEGQRERLGV